MPVAAGDIVGEQHLQEVVVRQPVRSGEGKPLGRGVEQLPELEARQRFQLRRDFDRFDRRRRGGSAGGAHDGLLTANSVVERTNRDGAGGGSSISCWPVPLVSMRSMTPTSMTSAAAGVVDRVGAVAAHQPE
ncbi:hypothetical protein [Nocardia sp. NPDC049707]|uniref:hypothetical protein n=1 Tax=Nocardia sp. NPDC049707 TaxID=3154735 RepID=UPI003425A2F2